ncbi:MAG TPA: YihY/virulence factor BrkB family protein [Gaiellaceae bacterium]|nr:YihY/virulence factor BrkB family protein [Gaiellaceae bacterium]
MRRYVREIAGAFAEHNLLTYAAAFAFQGLVALVPMTLLGLGMLGATGHREVWTQHIAPAIRGRVTPGVFGGIDETARRILDHGTAGLIAFSVVLSIWYLTAAMRAVMEALNRIHDVDDDRAWWVRAAIAAGLGTLAAAVLYGSAVLVIGGPRGVVLGLVRWVGAVAMLGVLVGLLVRYAPAQQPRARWASLGAALVVCSWLVASVLFRVYVTYLANFKSPVGSLTSLLVLTTYLFVSSTVFLVGVQLDELLRKRSRPSSGQA